ncbi:hypothetical protein BGW41_002926 [Actinomortierella wolfii]|nr:hypothetical protein BGW41_002926 [Actinomortierella wolfii]
MGNPAEPRLDQKHVQWALRKKKGEEHVTLPNFVRKFGFTNRESAYSAYGVLINDSQIDAQRSKRLQDAFNTFKSNAETLFWSAIESRIDTTLTSRKAGMITRAAGIQQAALDYDNLFGDKAFSEDDGYADFNVGDEGHITNGELMSPLQSKLLSETTSNKRKRSGSGEGSMSKTNKATKVADLSSRKQRFAAMGSSHFWILQSGRAVEQVLFEASLEQEANFNCKRTKSVFTDDEWMEIERLNDFQLPKLPESTEQYLRDVRKALVKGQHVASVPVPVEDQYSCELVLRAFLSWEAWPIMKVLLADVDGITMIDGEKAGLESGKRRNMGRKLDTEAPAPRKQAGRKEVSHAQFRKKARFFSVYSGGRGFKTMEMRTCPFSPFIMLVHMYDSYLLPSTTGTWKQQAQGLAHLLQVRACVTTTLNMYDACSGEGTADDSEEDDSDGEWLYDSTSVRVYDNTLGSSPMDPDSSIFYS